MRLLLKIALLLTLFFAACIGLIRAQPYDDRELHEFLTPPDGCPAPCWQGIHPGETRLNTAAAIIEAMPGVHPIERSQRFAGHHSAMPISVSLMTHPGAPAANPVVEMVRLRLPGTSYGELQLALGQPDRIMAYAVPEHGYAPFVAAYSRYGLYVLVDMPACNINQSNLWNTSRYVEIMIGNWLEYGSDYYRSSREFDMDRWANQLRHAAHCDDHGYEWVEAVDFSTEPMSH